MELACKHAVAALFALSDEVAIEPTLLERWRTGSNRRRPATPGLAEVVPLRRESPRAAPAAEPKSKPAPAPPRDPIAEEIGLLLGAPNGTSLPELPAVAPLQHTGIRDRQLAEVLFDAIAHLEINWE
jgi:hypothetical protein